MKGIMKYLIIFSILMNGCSQSNPVETIKTNNENYTVDFLFVHDGCSIYRFYDDGVHYYVDCSGSTNTRRLSGKTIRYEQIETRTNK